jgi:hypothetical protein
MREPNELVDKLLLTPALLPPRADNWRVGDNCSEERDDTDLFAADRRNPELAITFIDLELLSLDSEVEALDGNRQPKSPFDDGEALETRRAERSVSATVGRISTHVTSGERRDTSSESDKDISDFSFDSIVDTGVEWSDLPLSEPLVLAWRSSRHLCGPSPARR